MFRTMRRRTNEIDMFTIDEILTWSRRGVLAVNGDDGYPYAVPVNFFYDKAAKKIYFHGARAGYKANALRACDKVCFTVIGNEVGSDVSWAPYLKSVVVFGRCRLLDAGPESDALLKRFATKFYPSEALIDEEIARSGKAAQMFEIEIEHISGKQVQER